MPISTRLDGWCGPRNASAAREVDVENIHLYVELPFVPTIGMDIKPTRDEDYYRVVDVMLDLSPGGDGLRIGLEEPGPDAENIPTWKEMKKRGWQLSD